MSSILVYNSVLHDYILAARLVFSRILFYNIIIMHIQYNYALVLLYIILDYTIMATRHDEIAIERPSRSSIGLHL